MSKPNAELIRARDQILDGFTLLLKRVPTDELEDARLLPHFGAPILSIFVGIASDLHRIADALEKRQE